jgi:hypothetical protein
VFPHIRISTLPKGVGLPTARKPIRRSGGELWPCEEITKPPVDGCVSTHNSTHGALVTHLTITKRRGFHSSESDSTPHYTIRGLDANGLSFSTIHLYDGKPAQGWPNGGRIYRGNKQGLNYTVCFLSCDQWKLCDTRKDIIFLRSTSPLLLTPRLVLHVQLTFPNL